MAANKSFKVIKFFKSKKELLFTATLSAYTANRDSFSRSPFFYFCNPHSSSSFSCSCSSSFSSFSSFYSCSSSFSSSTSFYSCSSSFSSFYSCSSFSSFYSCSSFSSFYSYSSFSSFYSCSSSTTSTTSTSNYEIKSYIRLSTIFFFGALTISRNLDKYADSPLFLFLYRGSSSSIALNNFLL